MAADPLPAPAPGRRAAAAFVLATVGLDVLALGIIVPVLPNLVLGFLRGDIRHGTMIYGTFGLVWAAMQFLAAPVLGALSDRFGRRPVILLSNLGLGADYVLMALAPSLGWLFLGRMISGVTTASIPTAMAYIADVTPPERRAASFGQVGAAFGLGFVLGPALGGVLGQADPRLPFWVAAGLSAANACYGLFVLPESLPPDRRRTFAWRRANPVAALAIRTTRSGLGGLAAVNFLCYLAHEVYPSVFVLSAGYRFHWDERTVGWTLCGVGVCTVLTQALLTRPAVARLGERGAVLTGLCFGALGFGLYGLAGRPGWFWAAILLVAPWGIANPAILSLLSRQVGPNEQGALQGALGSLRGISGLLGPMLFTGTFAAFIPGGAAAVRGWTLPGAPFLLSGGLLLAALLTSALTIRRGQDAAPRRDEPMAPPSGFVPEVS